MKKQREGANPVPPSPKIVLVHLKTPIPRYVAANLERLRVQFPNSVHLITDSRLQPVRGVEYIHPDDLRISSEWNLPKGLMHFDLRTHLWASSYLRLILVAGFASHHQCVVHIESDVVVVWPEALAAWASSQPCVAYPMMDRNLAIASTLMINGPQSAGMFLQRLAMATESMSDSSDMDYLGVLANTWPEVALLPRVGIDDPTSRSSPALQNEIRQRALSVTGSATGFDHAIFDGAGLGVSLCGVDPIHTRGIVRTGTGKHRDQFAPRVSQVVVGGLGPEIGLDVLSESAPDTPMRVVTLHCNSKETRLFAADGQALCRRLRAFQPQGRVAGFSGLAIRELTAMKARRAYRRLGALAPPKSWTRH